MRLVSICLSVVLLCVPARAQDAALLIDLPLLGDAEAVERIDAALAEPEVSGNARLVVDLLSARAERLAALGRPAEAVEALKLAARIAERGESGRDPVNLLRRAAELLEDAGERRAAAETLRAGWEMLRGNGAGGMRLGALAAEIADLDPEVAPPIGEEPIIVGPDGEKAVPEATRGGAGLHVIEVLYATDRARTGEEDPAAFYGGARAEALDYGIAEVTIPEIHVPGRIERPSVFRLEFTADPARHVMLRGVTPVAEEAFFDSLSGRMSAGEGHDAVVFVHGYATGFDAAARRAAQLAYDMGYGGVPILYSWPSQGTTLGYIADAAAVRLSGRRLARFLTRIVEGHGAGRVHLVAHSMGNRALTDALELMSLRMGAAGMERAPFGQIIFAAPDVDRGLFAEMLGDIAPMGERLTLYASRRDWALETSRRLHGSAPRAGQGGAGMLVAEGLDSVDMSELGEDMLAHSYFAGDASALTDMLSLVWLSPDPERRCGLVPEGTGWSFARESCDGALLAGVLPYLVARRAGTEGEVRRVLSELVDPVMAERALGIVDRMLGPD